jgi:hypothetical protein
MYAASLAFGLMRLPPRCIDDVRGKIQAFLRVLSQLTPDHVLDHLILNYRLLWYIWAWATSYFKGWKCQFGMFLRTIIRSHQKMLRS